MELFLPLDLVDLLKCCLEVEQAKLLVEIFEWIYYKFDFLLLSPLSDTQQIIKIIFSNAKYYVISFFSFRFFTWLFQPIEKPMFCELHGLSKFGISAKNVIQNTKSSKTLIDMSMVIVMKLSTFQEWKLIAGMLCHNRGVRHQVQYPHGADMRTHQKRTSDKWKETSRQ